MEVVSLAAKIRAGVMVILLIILSLYAKTVVTAKTSGTLYLIYFEDSVAGLEKNASVQYNGIQIGSVIDFKPELTPFGMLTKVIIRVDPEDETLKESIKIYKDSDTLSHLTIESFDAVVGKEIGLEENYTILKVNDKEVKFERDFRKNMAEIFNNAYTSKGTETYKLTLKNLRTQQEKICEGNTDLGKILITFKDPDVLEKGTRAALSQNYVTGIKWVELFGGRAGLDELPGVKEKEEVSEKNEILVERGFLSKLTSEQNIRRITKVVDNVESILLNVSNITEEINKNLPEIVSRIKEFMGKEGDLGKFMDNLNGTLDSARQLWSEGGVLHGTLEDTQKMVNELRAQVREGKVHDLLTNTNEMIQKITDLTTQQDLWLIQTAEGYKKLANDISRELQQGGKLYSALHEMQTLLKELRDNINSGEIHKRIKELGLLLRNIEQVWSRDFQGAMLSFNKAMNEFYEGLASMTANPGNMIIGVKNKK